ncbi:S41 family peptidase [Clostridium carnis]
MKNIWEEKWIEDLEELKEKLTREHKNLFFNISKKDWENKIEDLKKIINLLDYNDMKVELSKIVASIKDAHTSITFPIKYIIPLEFFYFKEGIYIINTTEEYKSILYKKIISINDIKIDEVIREVEKVISYENKYFLKCQLVKYIQSVEVLYGLCIIDDINSISLEVEDSNNFIEKITIYPKAYNDIKYVSKDNIHIYEENSSLNYWFKVLEDNEIYIKYNSCREDNIDTIYNKIKETIKIIKLNNIQRVVIDFRNNSGGDSTLIEPLLEYIKENKIINKKGNLFIVIGRETFSSALLNVYEFKNKTNAILVGEPTGGKPNCYGEVKRFVLKNSGFNVSYSTKYYKLIEDDNLDSLYPDIELSNSIIDYINYK